MLDPGAQNLITEENLAGCPKFSVSIKKVLISTKPCLQYRNGCGFKWF